MPRFFIDTDDGEFYHHDEDGYDLADVRAARTAAIESLPDMARARMPDGEHRSFIAHVRNESGTVVYVATLTFTGEWKD